MSHRPLARVPEHNAVKVQHLRCAAKAVVRTRDSQCIGTAQHGSRLCWVHELIQREGRRVEVFLKGPSDGR